MNSFRLDHTLEILSQTPVTLDAMLQPLSPFWTESTGDKTDWAPYDVVGHLINNDLTNFIPRAEVILAQGENRDFPPFDRFAQFELSAGKPLSKLLTEFGQIREQSIAKVKNWNLTGVELDLKGIHPQFGEVTLSQLLSTWTVHDLTHIRQITIAMAKKYSDAVGPWKEYLSILK